MWYKCQIVMIETLKFYKNFPKEGINFIDIIPFLQSRKAFSEVIEALNKATTAPNTRSSREYYSYAQNR